MNSQSQQPLLSETDLAVFEGLYWEIMKFLHSCGGAYQAIEPRHCDRILECLDKGLSHVWWQPETENQEARITHFCSYWRIREADFPQVQRYERPANILDGDIIFFTDYAACDGALGLVRMFDKMSEIEPNAVAACFEFNEIFMIFDRTGNESQPWQVRR